uniref:uncharacterized protein n=1 Tax=Myxine glutinosa TaxID=7769 RepID=UPI00358F7204
MLLVHFQCGVCSLTTEWKSQPYIGKSLAGNIILSAGILMSGAVPSKVLKVLHYMRVAGISSRTFSRHQNMMLFPAIKHVWLENRKWLMASLQAERRGLMFGGDGRCDSPGHSAKFGSYAIVELVAKVIIDVELVQCNEVPSSCYMEKEGLKRVMAFLSKEGLSIDTMVMDRHVQVRKWMKENAPEVKRHFDVWHIAKGVKKKLLSLSKEKECHGIVQWMASIINHLYWCASSTPPGQPDTITAKWTSILNHLVNIHVHDNPHFPSCAHAPLVGREARKQWFHPCTPAMVKLEKLVRSPALLRDMRQLSGQEQTSSLEAFHSLLNHFAPKMYSFSYHGQLSRTLLAVMHFTENAGREQQRTAAGQARYAINFPKWKKGEYSVRKILKDPTYEYMREIMEVVVAQCTTSAKDRQTPNIDQPPALCAGVSRPAKDEAVALLQSRFAASNSSAVDV